MFILEIIQYSHNHWKHHGDHFQSLLPYWSLTGFHQLCCWPAMTKTYISIYIYWSYGGVFSLLLSPPAPILRANVFSCDRLASAWQMTPAKAAIISRQTRHSLLSWHLKTCWWLMIGLYTATITVGLIPDLSTVEWVNKDKQRLTYQAKWLVSGL